MSDLSATGCGCSGTSTNSDNGCSPIVWIILLLFLCGGCGNNNGGCGTSLFNNNSGNGCGCEILIVLLLLSCCSGNGFFGCNN